MEEPGWKVARRMAEVDVYLRSGLRSWSSAGPEGGNGIEKYDTLIQMYWNRYHESKPQEGVQMSNKIDAPRILAFDIETTPNRGWAYGKWQTNMIRIDEYSSLMSFSYQWLGEKDTPLFSGRI